MSATSITGVIAPENGGTGMNDLVNTVTYPFSGSPSSGTMSNGTALNNVITGNMPQDTFTFTLPSASLNAGKIFVIKLKNTKTNDAQTLRLTPAGSDKLEGLSTSTSFSVTAQKYSTVTIISDGTNWWIM